MINITAVIVAGLAGAAIFSMFTGMARSMGMTKMSIEKTMGAMFGEGTGATAAGWIMHFMMGVVFAIGYVVAFSVLGTTSGWLYGAVFGLLHGLMVGGVVLPMMGTIHPAVVAGKIEAPGFFAKNAGPMTPMGVIVGHVLFGTVIGGIYFLIA